MLIRTATTEEAARLAVYLPATHAAIEDDRLVGGLSLLDVRPGVRELSVWVLPEERRRGVATRAVRALTERCDGRVEIITDVADTVAQRVAQDAGFVREAVRRYGRAHDGGRGDDVVWAWLPGEPQGPVPRPLPGLPGGRLSDGEVILRPLGPEDADDVFDLWHEPDVRARFVVPRERPKGEVVRRCANAASEWLAGNRADLVIEVDGAFAGDIGLYNEAWSRQAMVGYSMLPAFRGRGIATRAVRLVAAWAFEIGVQRLIAGTMPDNTASQRVLEKAGFTRECVERSRFDGPDGTRLDDVRYVRFP